MALEWSHGKRRPMLPRPNGNDGGVASLPSEAGESAPMQDAKTGRFVKGNRAYRRRMVKEKAKGIHTLNPARCDAWLRPFVEEGAAYGVDLLQRIAGDPVLARLAGDVADAHTVYRALLALAAKGDAEALRESRAWLREHRAALATLSGLVAEAAKDGGDGSEDDFVVKESIP